MMSAIGFAGLVASAGVCAADVSFEANDPVCAAAPTATTEQPAINASLAIILEESAAFIMISLQPNG
ncbi:hypothetical protein [Sphingobium sp. CFD-1]|uniref:hypothetical protein n=1 Tax=Sphingobium sp. CFD-1 TaxID=2878545 RepID=UPI00214B9F5D|nr:hypothetical protein [Sphingobium sp. CFD-1]